MIYIRLEVQRVLASLGQVSLTSLLTGFESVALLALKLSHLFFYIKICKTGGQHYSDTSSPFDVSEYYLVDDSISTRATFAGWHFPIYEFSLYSFLGRSPIELNARWMRLQSWLWFWFRCYSLFHQFQNSIFQLSSRKNAN